MMIDNPAYVVVNIFMGFLLGFALLLAIGFMVCLVISTFQKRKR